MLTTVGTGCGGPVTKHNNLRYTVTAQAHQCDGALRVTVVEFRFILRRHHANAISNPAGLQLTCVRSLIRILEHRSRPAPLCPPKPASRDHNHIALALRVPQCRWLT
jgi:hypothetical protein